MLEITRRKYLLTTTSTIFASISAGCLGDDSTIVDGEAHSRDSWRFELEEGDKIRIHVEVVERSEWDNAVSIELETVERGTIERWTLPYSDVEEEYFYTADSTDEYNLKVDNAGIAEVVVEHTD